MEGWWMGFPERKSRERANALLFRGDRIQTWALEEARRRLEAEGILPDPSAAGSGSGKK